MRTFVALFAVLSVTSTATLAQSAMPQVVLLHPGTDGTEAIVIPSGSSMHLASFPRDFESSATFRGRFTLSGMYEVTGYGENASVTMWPDRKSRDGLPYWRVHGGPDEIDISNGWAFTRAVVPRDKLQKLKAARPDSVKGRVTIIADNYQTSIVCDVASFSARFISVVKAVQIAANPQSEEGC